MSARIYALVILALVSAVLLMLTLTTRATFTAPKGRITLIHMPQVLPELLPLLEYSRTVAATTVRWAGVIRWHARSTLPNW